jgi:small ubiquitin-related modifier
MILYDLILLGLLTVVYGTSNLCDTNGAPVAVGPNEVAIFAGLALARATTTTTTTTAATTTTAIATINGNDIATVPSAFHSVSASMHDKQHSLVFRCRGNKDALLPSTGVVSSSAGASNSSSSSSSITLAEFYEQFKLSHRSVNEEIPPASNAATATTTATTTPVTATATTATTTDANGATATAATATAVSFPIAAPDPPPDISVAPIIVITVRVIDQGPNEMSFTIRETTPINRILKSFSARMGIPMESLRFMFQGKRLHGRDDYTAKTYKMKDGDQIDVHLEAAGD